jgi:hypothetical protein
VQKIVDSLKFRLRLPISFEREDIYTTKILGKENIDRRLIPISIRQMQQNWLTTKQGFQIIKHELLSFLKEIELPDTLENFTEQEFQLLHVRRGDYLLNPEAWGLLSYEYYMENMNKSIPTVIVTDDQSFVKRLKNNFLESQILGPKDLDQFQTLKVMSKATEIMAANSSFSWWGSLLAKEFSNAKVIMPNPWFKNVSEQPAFFGDPSIVYKDSIFE